MPRIADLRWAALSVTLLLLGSHYVHCKAGKAIHSFAGKFIVHADSFYSCEGRYDWNWNFKTTHWNPGKPKELQHLTGWVNGTDHAVSDAYWLHVVLDTRSNNMWKENAFVFHFANGACSTLKKNIPDAFRIIFKTLPQSEKVPCVLIPQLYEVNDEPVAWVFPNIPVLPYGLYRFRLNTGPPGSKSTVACLIVEAQVVPKVS